MKVALKALLAVLVLALSTAPLHAQDAAASATPAAAVAPAPGAAKPTNPPKTEDVTFPSGKDTIAGYLALPDKEGPRPAILVIHEWWGLTPWIKTQTEELSALGYIALAVDLYGGKSATDPNEAHELSRGLPQDRGVRDIQAAYDYLLARKDVNKERLAVIGWCMGGGYALQFAIRQPHLSGVVVNYGALPTDPNDLQQIAAPVLGNFGAEDKGITPTDVKDFETAMKKANKYVDIKEYSGAGHAFENPNNETGYRPKAAADAWVRTIAFLRKALGA